MSSCTLEVCTVSTDTLLTGSGFAWCEGDKTSIKQVLICEKKEDIGNNSWTLFFILEGNKAFVHLWEQKWQMLYRPTLRGLTDRLSPHLWPLSGLISILPSLSLAQAECYIFRKCRVVMEEKKQWCKRCHGGILRPTLWPNEFKCNYCGWSKVEVNLADYLASKGDVGP